MRWHASLPRVHVGKVSAEHGEQRPPADDAPKPDDLQQQRGVEREAKAKAREKKRVGASEFDRGEEADGAAGAREGRSEWRVAARLLAVVVLRELRQQSAGVEQRRRALRKRDRARRRVGEPPRARSQQGVPTYAEIGDRACPRRELQRLGAVP